MKFNNRNVNISSKATIGINTRIGDNTVIYDNVVIGDNCTICNDCVIGEPPNDYYQQPDAFVNPPTIIGNGAFIRSHCILYAGSTFGNHLITGHRATIRENSIIGNHCLISTLVDIQGNCSIGNYSRIYSNVHVSELTSIGDYVLIFPFTIFTNDPQPPSNTLKGATVGNYSVIAVHCVICPGVSVGSNCLIGANSVVTRNIEDNSFALGTPAKRISDIREIPSKENHLQQHYPWPSNFERGYPWQGTGFEKWKQLSSEQKS